MTEQQKDFVQMYLKHRCKITAHNIAYGANSNYDSVESSANRLLNIPEIAETIRQVEDTIRHEVEEEFKSKYREELLTIYDKRLLLKKIATGEMYIEQKYKGKNCTQCSQYISPTYHMMMQALKEDSKLAGHYPYKVAGKWVIPALQTEQEEILSENIIDNISPSGAGGEQETQDENSNNPEKENNRQQISLSPAGGGVSLSADGGGIREEQETPPKKDNNGQQLTSPLGRGWGGSTPDGQTAQDEKDNNLAERLNETNEKDINKRINGQQITETSTDNQPLTNSLKTSVNSSGKLINKATQLKE